jgi:hypothetical protein
MDNLKNNYSLFHSVAENFRIVEKNIDLWVYSITLTMPWELKNVQFKSIFGHILEENIDLL